MSNEQSPLEVEGEVILGEEAASFSGGTVRVFLDDISRPDRASAPIAEQTIPEVSHQGGTERRLPFRLRGQRVDPRSSYSVRVHVALKGGEEIQVGDYITMQTYPVCGDKNSDRVAVNVREVC